MYLNIKDDTELIKKCLDLSCNHSQTVLIFVGNLTHVLFQSFVCLNNFEVTCEQTN